MRDWRKTHPLTLEQRKKDNCRSYAGTYYRRGKLIKENCKNCKNEKSQMHHPDYDFPLMVVWLCRKCHLKHHRFHVSQKPTQLLFSFPTTPTEAFLA